MKAIEDKNIMFLMEIRDKAFPVSVGNAKKYLVLNPGFSCCSKALAVKHP